VSTTEPINDEAAAEREVSPSSRRSLLGKGAIAAAAAATAGLVVNGRSASAADGGPVVIAGANASTTATDTALTGGSTFVVTDGSSNGSGTAPNLVKSSILGKQTQADSVGVMGSATGAGGYGVWGEHTGTAGAGVVAIGSTIDLKADGAGTVLLNKPLFTTTPPTTTVVGTIGRGPDGALYYSPVAGEWVRLARAGGSTSAGEFHVIAPVRVYDSRLPVPTPNGKLSTGQNRLVSIKDARNEATGVVTTADVVPVGATAIVCNLTVTETEGDLGGFLSVVPGDATAASGSSINWSGLNQNIANGLTAKIAADRTVKVFCGGVPTPRTHFVIDVTGYWI